MKRSFLDNQDLINYKPLVDALVFIENGLYTCNLNIFQLDTKQRLFVDAHRHLYDLIYYLSLHQCSEKM